MLSPRVRAARTRFRTFGTKPGQKFGHLFAWHGLVHPHRIFHRIHPCLDTIGFRFWLLNTAAVPHASVFGSIANSTPLLCSTRHVAWTSSLQNVTDCGFSIWLSMFVHAKKHQFGI